VMPLQGAPCGSGGDIRDLLRIGGHVFDPSAAGFSKV
jgi:phosphoribosylformylglycinamidine (FGAM) synthase-like enzyme